MTDRLANISPRSCALAVGALISAALLAMDLLNVRAGVWAFGELPGMTAAYLFWGAAGSSVVAGVAIAFVVNAVVCGALAFAAFLALKWVARALPK